MVVKFGDMEILNHLKFFYRKFIKRVLGLDKITPNCIVYGEVGKYPIIHRVYRRMISFWAKISEGKSSKLSSIMYKIIYKLHLCGEYDSPWLIAIKNIICNSGSSHFWYDQELFSPKTFIKNDISLQLENQYFQQWQLDVDKNRKCVAYRIFKDDIVFESYLNELEFLDRRALCKFRSGNHRLPVAMSRIDKKGVGAESKCKLCNSHDICDEFHVLFLCKYFETARIKYLKRNHYIRPSTLKMYTLFHSHGKQLINLAKFIRIIMSTF